MGGGWGGKRGGAVSEVPCPPPPTRTLRFISHDPSKCCEEVQKCSLPLELLYFLYFAADEGEFMTHQHLICTQKKKQKKRVRRLSAQLSSTQLIVWGRGVYHQASPPLINFTPGAIFTLRGEQTTPINA